MSDSPEKNDDSKPKSNHMHDCQAHDCQDPAHHDHDEEGAEGEEELFSLTPALLAARTGLKSQVQLLVDALSVAHIYIPLSEDMPDTPEGERVELEGELSFRPHMILNHDHSIFAVAFSEPSLVEAIQSALGWETSGGELKFICVPAHVALDLAQLDDLEGESVSGVVFNPGTDEELVLQRDEVASLAQGTAIPLVGYVADVAPGEEGETQVVEGAAPPPSELIDALNRAKDSLEDLVGVSVQTTFNPERDREPHLTIELTVIGRHDLDRQALADTVMEEAGPHLPTPGYADIVFRDAPN